MIDTSKKILLGLFISLTIIASVLLVSSHLAFLTISPEYYTYLLVIVLGSALLTPLLLLLCRRPIINITNNSYSIDYAALIDAFSDGIFIIDDKNLIRFFNKEAQKITGHNAHEALNLIYSSVLQLVNQDGQPIDINTDPIIISRRTGQSQQLDMLYLKTYSGKIIPISANICIPDEASNFVIVAFRDISAKLDQERDQMEFISTASHEMRTPIAAIDGYLGLVLNPSIATIDDKAREYITKAQKSSQHLGELFKNLLSISKAEDKRLKIDLQPVNLAELISDTCSDFRQAATDKGLQLIFDADNLKDRRQIKPDIFVHADQSLLREALSNLIENAIKYTEKGSVSIEVSLKDNDRAIISVTDTGIGIAPEDLPHLFQKFYRVDNSQTREIGGTGLGLYLTRSVIENMSGRVWAESKFGHGSRFFIELRRLDRKQRDRILQTVEALPNSDSDSQFPTQ